MPLVPYAETCAALKSTADFLRLPWSTAATGLVLLHRFKRHPESSSLTSDVRAKKPIGHQPSSVNTGRLLGSGCLLCCAGFRFHLPLPGSKGGGGEVVWSALGCWGCCCPLAETLDTAQSGVSTQQLVNTVACLPCTPVEDDAANAETQFRRPPVVGREYDGVKKQLITHEQLLLRCIQFNIAIEHPYKYLLNYCNLLKVPSSICQSALCVINDSLSLTQLCLTHAPATVAAGALWMAMEKLDTSNSRSWPDNWAQLIGVAIPALQDSQKQLREMYPDNNQAGIHP